MSFELHPQLAADTHHVGRLRLCRVLLMNDSRYPWLILVPERAGIREIFELTSEDREILWAEINFVAERMQRHFDADKMNIAALGNMVPQLHIHVIARFATDPAWPRPVWGAQAAEPYTAAAADKLTSDLQTLLGTGA